VGTAGQAAVPEQAIKIDASGKSLVRGFVDMRYIQAAKQGICCSIWQMA
jgi:hypothetical protein